MALCSVLAVAAFVGSLFFLQGTTKVFSSVAEFFQGLDAFINELVFVGLALLFLFTVENRIKRSRALKSLYVLRSLAHIVDMHQLTKDPERVAGGGRDTPSSPKRVLTPFELTRYLDYCSEMLALLSKLAALHTQHFNDPVTLEAVNDVENLTQGLGAHHLAEDHDPRPDPRRRLKALSRAGLVQRPAPLTFSGPFTNGRYRAVS